MYESVDIGGLLVDFKEALILKLLLVGSLGSKYHFHSLAE